MVASSAVLIHAILLCRHARTGLSVPATAFTPARNVADAPSVYPLAAPLEAVRLLNVTSPLQDTELRYMVPGTQIEMFFNLGFPVDQVAMRDTIDAARKYCDLQIERSGDVPLPQSEDPFDDDLGYGAAVHVVSTRPRHRLTWRILRGIMQGLWDVLVEQGRYLEAEFYVRYANVGSVGRGTITEAQEAPGLEQ